jgi:hypothetical protein
MTRAPLDSKRYWQASQVSPLRIASMLQAVFSSAVQVFLATTSSTAGSAGAVWCEPPASPEFTLTDGFIFALHRKAELAFTLVGGLVALRATLPVTPSVTPPVTPPVEVLARLLEQAGELGNSEVRARLGLKDRTHPRERYVAPALSANRIRRSGGCCEHGYYGYDWPHP